MIVDQGCPHFVATGGYNVNYVYRWLAYWSLIMTKRHYSHWFETFHDQCFIYRTWFFIKSLEHKLSCLMFWSILSECHTCTVHAHAHVCCTFTCICVVMKRKSCVPCVLYGHEFCHTHKINMLLYKSTSCD